MFNSCKTLLAIITASILLTVTSLAQATLVSYTIIGDVIDGDELFPNAFGLTAGETITATGIFDDSVLTTGSGTVSFGSGSGNTMNIQVGTATFSANDDISFMTGFPELVFNTSALSEFNFTDGTSFNSNFLFFDDFDALFGQWRTNVTFAVVPVPAAVWLFGSGLLGLVGVARRRKAIV